MIKLGANAYIKEKDNPDKFLDALDFLEFARELDLDVIDFCLGRGLSSTDPDYLSEVKIKCLKYGLPIGYLLSVVGLAGPEDHQMAEKMAQAKRDVDLTSFLGAQICHVFARGGEVPDDSPEYEPLWAQMIRRFQEVSDYAADKGVIVGVQNHNNGSWARRSDQVVRIMEETNRDNFTLILDTGQWQGSIGSDPRGVIKDPNPNVHEEHIEMTAPYAGYVRAKIYKVDSGIEEYLDYRRIIEILRAVNYNGNLSIVLEHQGTQFDDYEAMRRAAVHLRELLST